MKNKRYHLRAVYKSSSEQNCSSTMITFVNIHCEKIVLILLTPVGLMHMAGIGRWNTINWKDSLGQTFVVSALWSFSQGYFHGALASNVYCWTIAKYSQENFCGTLKNHENRKSLAQWIFPIYSIGITFWHSLQFELHGLLFIIGISL